MTSGQTLRYPIRRPLSRRIPLMPPDMEFIAARFVAFREHERAASRSVRSVSARLVRARDRSIDRTIQRGYPPEAFDVAIDSLWANCGFDIQKVEEVLARHTSRPRHDIDDDDHRTTVGINSNSNSNPTKDDCR